MRSPFYVWSDGETVTIGAGGGFGDSVTMPEETLEELAVMVTLELLLDRDDGKGLEKVMEVAERAHRKHGGNFGADGASLLVGAPTSLDILVAAAEARRASPFKDALSAITNLPPEPRRRWRAGRSRR